MRVDARDPISPLNVAFELLDQVPENDCVLKIGFGVVAATGLRNLKFDD